MGCMAGGSDEDAPDCGPASAPVPTVIVLNGGSSAGKSSIARALQDLLPDPWLTLGADTLVEAMPARLTAPGPGIEFKDDGTVVVGEGFRVLEAAWIRGIAGMAHAGARIILDEVFLGGRRSQDRWHPALEGLGVLWVAVHCDPDEAERREARRPDRIAGMARKQALAVHAGVSYDAEVDTTCATPDIVARELAGHVRQAPEPGQPAPASSDQS